jgi:hypothetical protein
MPIVIKLILALLLALVSRENVRQANVPMFEAPKLSRGIVHNVSICVRAGLLKPRPVPDNERIKDTKTLDYASTPLDANTLLPAVRISNKVFAGHCVSVN